MDHVDGPEEAEPRALRKEEGHAKAPSSDFVRPSSIFYNVFSCSTMPISAFTDSMNDGLDIVCLLDWLHQLL